jgi:hypothetical protein
VGDLCRAFLKEAKWYYAGYTPTLQEYLDNAWLSISGQVILGHAFFLVTNQLTEEAVRCCMEYPDLIRHSSTILRLADDLGTSSVYNFFSSNFFSYFSLKSVLIFLHFGIRMRLLEVIIQNQFSVTCMKLERLNKKLVSMYDI